MSESKPLLFISQLKEFLSEDPDIQTPNDWVYTDAINTTTELFETIIGYSFTKQEYSELFTVTGKQISTLYLNAFPIDETAPFKVFLYSDSEDYSIEYDNSNYSIDYKKGVITITGYIYGSVKVEYTAGYSYGTNTGVVDNPADLTLERSLGLNIPSSLKIAALKQAAMYVVASNPSPCNTSSKNVLSTPKTNYSLFGINPMAMILLSSYKRPKIRFV